MTSYDLKGIKKNIHRYISQTLVIGIISGSVMLLPELSALPMDMNLGTWGSTFFTEGAVACAAAEHAGKQRPVAPTVLNDGWDPSVAQAVNDFVAQHTHYIVPADTKNGKTKKEQKSDKADLVIKGRAVALFDLDNTAPLRNAQRLVAGWQLDHLAFAMTPEQLDRQLRYGFTNSQLYDLYSSGSGDRQKASIVYVIDDVVAAYTKLYNEGYVTPRGLKDSVKLLENDHDYQEFKAKMAWIMNTVNDNYSLEQMTVWNGGWFTGMSSYEAFNVAYDCFRFHGKALKRQDAEKANKNQADKTISLKNDSQSAEVLADVAGNTFAPVDNVAAANSEKTQIVLEKEELQPEARNLDRITYRSPDYYESKSGVLTSSFVANIGCSQQLADLAKLLTDNNIDVVFVTSLQRDVARAALSYYKIPDGHGMVAFEFPTDDNGLYTSAMSDKYHLPVYDQASKESATQTEIMKGYKNKLPAMVVTDEPDAVLFSQEPGKRLVVTFNDDKAIRAEEIVVEK